MNQESLIRFAMTVQNNAPTTINKYICKLAEEVIFDSERQSMTLLEIADNIRQVYGLEFDVFEIQNALKHKGNGNIICVGTDLFQLSVKSVEHHKKQNNSIETLNIYVELFLKEFKVNFERENVVELILKYIYFCFNSNIENLMSLIKQDFERPLKDFKGNQEDIKIINEFIHWDNLEKNKFLYSVIAFSYDYCALSAKKDTLFSKKMFSGKKFILDTNIIFRMAGINNDERKYVITSFVRKCREVGIQLFYTDAIFDEIYRVIDGNIRFIQHLTQNEEPIDYELIKDINNYEINDFYKLYYSWTKKPENKYNDFVSFQQYLYSLIRDVICDLDVIYVNDYSMTKNKVEFEQYANSLKEYKNSKRSYRQVTRESVKTDINNLLHTRYTRKSNLDSIWQTNEFIVSADQMLTNWAKESFGGVPLVVIPSVWLSIILRFTGRASEDDYRSYCLFLGLRQNPVEKFAIDSVALIQEINNKTSDLKLKERIIREIITNKTEYNFSLEQDYDGNTQKAFDIIINDIAEKNSAEVEKIKDKYERSIDEKKKEKEFAIADEKREAAQQREKYALGVAEKISNDKIKKWEVVNMVYNFIAIVWALFIVATFLGYAYNIKPLEQLALMIIPEKCDTVALQFQYIISINTFVNGVLIAALKVLFGYLSSEKRKTKIKDKIYEKYLK